jgi:hypothetical protein
VLTNDTNETQYPLSFKNGELSIDDTIIQIPIKNNIDVVEIKLKGFNDITKDLKIIMCAYIFDGEAVNYISNGEISIGIDGTSFNDLVNAFQE